MSWAAAMGIKVGGLPRTVAQPRPHADRLPNEDSSCDSRHECVPRAATRPPPLLPTVRSTRVRARDTCEIFHNYARVEFRA